MALIVDLNDSYTKTGKGTPTLTRWANGLSYIPFFGGMFSFGLGLLATGIETVQWLFLGKFGSAVTAAAAGTASSFVNGLTQGVPGISWWLGNSVSGVATGETLGTHARAATEALIGGVTGALGSKPQVLRSYPAGIGSIGAGAVPQGPGKFLSEAARSRGEDPNAAYARMTSNQADHLAALQAAQSQGGQRSL